MHVPRQHPEILAWERESSSSLNVISPCFQAVTRPRWSNHLESIVWSVSTALPQMGPEAEAHANPSIRPPSTLSSSRHNGPIHLLSSYSITEFSLISDAQNNGICRIHHCQKERSPMDRWLLHLGFLNLNARKVITGHRRLDLPPVVLPVVAVMVET